MKLFFDTNILIDVFSHRDKESDFSIYCYRLVEHNLIKGYINAKQLSDIYYIASKIADKKTALEICSIICELFVVVPYDKFNLINAFKSDFTDIEDASIDDSAKLYCCDGLITRNSKHFTKAKSVIYSPKEFQTLYEAMKISWN